MSGQIEPLQLDWPLKYNLSFCLPAAKVACFRFAVCKEGAEKDMCNSGKSSCIKNLTVLSFSSDHQITDQAKQRLQSRINNLKFVYVALE